MNCKNCINRRRVISENGYHSVCCLSNKKAMECRLENGKYKVELKEENTNDERC